MTINTADYRNAPSRIGPLANQWLDKPHRLVYDLVTAIEGRWTDEWPTKPGAYWVYGYPFGPKQPGQQPRLELCDAVDFDGKIVFASRSHIVLHQKEANIMDQYLIAGPVKFSPALVPNIPVLENDADDRFPPKRIFIVAPTAAFPNDTLHEVCATTVKGKIDDIYMEDEYEVLETFGSLEEAMKYAAELGETQPTIV
jgi:hypothetical protein